MVVDAFESLPVLGGSSENQKCQGCKFHRDNRYQKSQNQFHYSEFFHPHALNKENHKKHEKTCCAMHKYGATFRELKPN